MRLKVRSGMAGMLLVALAFGRVSVRGQSSVPTGEWRHWMGDLRASHYSPLDQINGSNVKDLRVAWRWKSENMGPRPDNEPKATPIMVGGVLYTTAGPRRKVVAIDAATGETLWMYYLDEGSRARSTSGQPTGRGVSYWTDGKGDERLLYITQGYQLVALNRKTGQPVPSFGKDGVVDLLESYDDTGRTIKPGEYSIGQTSPPTVFGDLLIVDASVEGAASPQKESLPGFLRGLDARTGKVRWVFRTIPRPGEFGNETWLRDSWAYTGSVGAWATPVVDEELGYLYIHTDLATNDYYGGNRPGNNLFSNSLVCLDTKTGKRIWYFQDVHHDIWDLDPGSSPSLLDVTISGRRVKAIAQVTKQGFIFVFDRVTGKPLWPIEERPVPKSNISHEWTAPTQPFPTKPAPIAKQGVTEEDLIDFTPELHAQAVEIFKKYRTGPLYTPAEMTPAGTLMLPSPNGGASWQGAAVDPETGMIYVGTANTPRVLSVRPAPPGTAGFIGSARFLPEIYPQGLPLLKPPYGQINAIDLNTGDTKWVIPNGDTPDYIKNHPALKGLQLGRTGSSDAAGLLVTKTLLFAGVPGTHGTLPPRQGRPELLAIDKTTGAVIFEFKLPDGLLPTGVPMTYSVNGKQYIAFWAGAMPPATSYVRPGELISLSLP